MAGKLVVGVDGTLCNVSKRSACPDTHAWTAPPGLLTVLTHADGMVEDSTEEDGAGDDDVDVDETLNPPMEVVVEAVVMDWVAVHVEGVVDACVGS